MADRRRAAGPWGGLGLAAVFGLLAVLAAVELDGLRAALAAGALGLAGVVIAAVALRR